MNISAKVRALILGGSLFLVGAALVFLSLSLPNGSLMLLAVAAFGGSIVSLVASVFLSRRTDDVLDQRRQQRLWRSGRLGRRWLKSRRRLP